MPTRGHRPQADEKIGSWAEVGERQWIECPHLDTIRLKKSGIASSLLRPMCENMLYLMYLGGLPPNTADKIIILGAHREILESIIAQGMGAGRRAAAAGPDARPAAGRLLIV
jgi:hypothetical protein